MRFITKRTNEDDEKEDDIASIMDTTFDWQNGSFIIWQFPNKNEIGSYKKESDEPVRASINLNIPALEHLRNEIDKMIVGIKNAEIKYRKELSENYKHIRDRDNVSYEISDPEDDELDDDLKTYFSDSPDRRG